VRGDFLTQIVVADVARRALRTRLHGLVRSAGHERLSR
jgi:hypothetical protein